MTPKYEPLEEHLRQTRGTSVDMSFEDIERLIGPLPKSASRYDAWWSNEAAGGRHVQAHAWRVPSARHQGPGSSSCAPAHALRVLRIAFQLLKAFFQSVLVVWRMKPG